MKILTQVAGLLVIIGAINWGLVGFFGYNLVSSLLGTGMLETLVYDLVGVSGIWVAYNMYAKGGK